MGLSIIVLTLALVALCQATSRECVQVYGYSSCAYFQRAKCWADALDASHFTATVQGGDRDQYQDKLRKLKDEHDEVQKTHRTSPLVLRGCGDEKHYIGGSDDFVKFLKGKGVAAPAGCW
jgi:hypothetical protein